MKPMDKSSPILVTGASGFIAGWIVKFLLEDGFTVHATVRDPARSDKVAHLSALAEKGPGHLKLFAADLLAPGSFDEAMQGCELVLHTASPFRLGPFKDVQAELILPALEGTRNVLAAVDRTATVRRVVLTSSVAAIYGDGIDLQNVAGGVFTEEHWNTTSSGRHQPYSYSKTLAEKEAWAIAGRQDRWDLVTINPSMVFGPSLTNASASGSIALMKQFGDGTAKFGVPDLKFGLVDVREVARAHILAGLTPEAAGRHIVSAGRMSLLEIGTVLRRRFGDSYPFPRRVSPKFVIWLLAPFLGITREFVSKNVGHPVKFDHQKSIDALGLAYRPVEETIVAHFQQIVDDGLLG